MHYVKIGASSLVILSFWDFLGYQSSWEGCVERYCPGPGQRLSTVYWHQDNKILFSKETKENECVLLTFAGKIITYAGSIKIQQTWGFRYQG